MWLVHGPHTDLLPGSRAVIGWVIGHDTVVLFGFLHSPLGPEDSRQIGLGGKVSDPLLFAVDWTSQVIPEPVSEGLPDITKVVHTPRLGQLDLTYAKSSEQIPQIRLKSISHLP